MGFLDFFKPQWKHSEPGVRAAAIRALEEDQQPLLLTLALEDQDPANRLIASRKLKDPELLKKLRDRTTDRAIKDMAQKAWVEAQGWSLKDIAQPARVALTGRGTSPGLFEMMQVMGKQRSLARLQRAAERAGALEPAS